MDPISGAMSMGGSLLSGILGYTAAEDQRNQALNAYGQSVNDYNQILNPSISDQLVNLGNYQSAGNLNPTLQTAQQLGPSAMQGISTDPNFTGAQQQALSSLQNIGNNGGMTLTDQANLENTMNSIRAQEAGSRGAILQHAAEQGGYGNGSALVAQLMNQQNAATNEHAAGLESAATAQQRALNALQGAGQLGGQMQATQFGQQAQKAQAQDAINRWNAANAQSVQGSNVGMQNQAQASNLANQQAIMNQNTGLQNQQQIYNKQLQQQQFNDALALAQGKANARAGQASALTANAQQTANMFAGMGQAASQAASAYGNYQQQQANNQANQNMMTQYLNAAYPQQNYAQQQYQMPASQSSASSPYGDYTSA